MIYRRDDAAALNHAVTLDELEIEHGRIEPILVRARRMSYREVAHAPDFAIEVSIAPIYPVRVAAGAQRLQHLVLEHHDVLASGVQIDEVHSEYVLKVAPIGSIDFKAFIVPCKYGAPGQVAFDKIIAGHMPRIVLDGRVFHNAEPAECGLAPLDEFQRCGMVVGSQTKGMERRANRVLL